MSPSDVTPWLMVFKAIYDLGDLIACRIRERRRRRALAAKEAK